MFRRISADSTWPTGRRRSPSWTLPSGRPRWLASTTFAPCERSVWIVGIAARIRESSVTLPSASGTLKSTRTKTRLPAASRSRMVSLSMIVRLCSRPSGAGGRRGRETGGHESDEIGDAAAVAPLVVVPADDLHHRSVEDRRRRRVDDRAAAVAPAVSRHERVVADTEDALHRPVGGGPERVVYLLDAGRGGLGGGGVVGPGGRRRVQESEAVECALEVRDHERQGLRRAGRRRDYVLAGGPRPARVLVGDVEDPLVVRVAVDRVHQAALDRQQVVDDLCRRRETV